MSPKPKLGLIIPTIWGGGVPDGHDVAAFCRRADELGFDSLWVISRMLHKNAVGHPMMTLSYAAAVTERVGLGTAVELVNVRHPVELAQQAATLDALSGGRITLGVSMGGRDIEYEAMGVPISQRLGRLLESTTVLRKLWTESDVTFDGRYYHLRDANIAPKPSRPGGIPLLFGAATEASLRRAGRLADGWIQGGRGTPETFAKAWATVQEGAREAGKDPAKLANGKLLYTNLATTRDVAAHELERTLSYYYGPGYPMEHTACGTPDDVAAIINRLGAAGCQTLMLGLPSPDLAKLELLAKSVMPLVEA